MLKTTIFNVTIALILQLMLSVHAAGESWGVDALMRELAIIKHTEANFTEKRYSYFLKQPIIVKGTLSFRAPDTLIKHSLTPNDERLEVAGDSIHIKMYREDKLIERELSIYAYPALLPLVQGVRSTLAGDLTTLLQHYRLKLEGGREQWHLLLLPKVDPNEEGDGLAEIIRSINIKGRGSKIHHVEITEINGDRSVMAITAK